MRHVPTLLLFATVLHLQCGWAGDIRGSMHVSATVVAHASVAALDGAAPVTITAADLARGYVDVDRRYRLRSNSPRGLLLQLSPRVGLARSIEITGLPSALAITDTNVDVVRPGNEDLQLRFRFWLQPLAAPGEYPLPLHIAAIAI